MNAVKEIERRDKRISDYKKRILDLSEEIAALRQLLDCAAANMVMLVEKKGGVCKLSKSDVSNALGRYRLCARYDTDGNYVLETVAEETE